MGRSRSGQRGSQESLKRALGGGGYGLTVGRLGDDLNPVVECHTEDEWQLVVASSRRQRTDMSAVRQLSGVNRTCRGKPISAAIDPGCVKTCAHEKHAELFSLLFRPCNRRQHFCFSN
jgi:hypothetical protein